MMERKTLGLLLICVGGIYASYLTQGVVQELLATKRYGTEQVRARTAFVDETHGMTAVHCHRYCAKLVLLYK
jgi:solute carrier family 35 (UDP-galactose transporter), member B1